MPDLSLFSPVSAKQASARLLLANGATAGSGLLLFGGVVRVFLGEGKGGIKVKLAWDFGKK